MNQQQIITILSVLLFLFFYIYGAYLYSYKHGHITLNSYDANVALAYGNKPFIIITSAFAFGLLIWLMILNKHQSKFYIRTGLLAIIFILIQVLLWLNPSELSSIIIGGIVLAFMRIFIITTFIVMFKTKNISLLAKVLYASIIILAYIGVILQISFAFFAQNYYQIIHPGLENYVILLFLITVIILGF